MSKEIKNIIAYQGERGSNSHIACAACYPDWGVLPCVRFDETFAAVNNGAAALAMLPIENTQAGRVADIHRLLPHSGLYIIGEYFLPVHHQLLGVEAASIADITHIHSHEMALAQCGAAIKELDLTPVIAADTAGAARQIAEAGDPAHAAIAGALAAEIYGLKILRRDIEDSHTNTTRFLIMSPKRDDAPLDETDAITSFIFQVKNQPAALYKVLGCFATNGVNVTKLESHQKGSFLATQFYADIEGHEQADNIKQALEEVRFHCDELQILGVYPAGEARKNW